MTRFAEAAPPPEALKQPPPRLEDVDSHPDALFIWAVILATRRDCALTRSRSYVEDRL